MSQERVASSISKTVCDAANRALRRSRHRTIDGGAGAASRPRSRSV